MGPGGGPKTGVVFDGSLVMLAAYDAAVRIARNTTFGDGVHSARWLDDHYSPGPAGWGPEFRSAITGLADIAANLLADVLHSAVLEANATAPPHDPATWPRLTE